MKLEQTTIRIKKQTLERLQKYLNKMSYDEGIMRMLDILEERR